MISHHYQNGLYFTRNDDGSIDITQKLSARYDETAVKFHVTIPADDWKQILAVISPSSKAIKK